MEKTQADDSTGESQKRVRTRRGEGRGRLLDAFVRLAAREGIDSVTYRSLAKEAGVTSGLASYHFPDRETLIREAVSYAVAKTIKETRLTAPYPKLEDFGKNVARFVEEEPWDAAFQYDLLVRAWRDPATRSQLQTLYDQYIDAIQESLFAAGIVASRPLSRLVFAMLDGMVVQQLIYGRPADTDETVGLLRDVLRLLADRRQGDGGGAISRILSDTMA